VIDLWRGWLTLIILTGGIDLSVGSILAVAQPTAGTGYELDAIAAVVLGGTACPAAAGASSARWARSSSACCPTASSS
jgi:ribose/xylose/arabinose/galactoside ABC-type transport system permease subunit